jgi:hypothetical protein
MTLLPCPNGSHWANALTVNHVQEELKEPYPVEKCDYMEGCKCTIGEVIPEKARGRPFDTVNKYDTPNQTKHTLLELR